MKPLISLVLALGIASCGTIGIGSNHETTIYNNSADTISVSSDSGIFKIKPDSSLPVNSGNGIAITNPNESCPQPIVTRRPNGPAIFFDVFPGIIFGIVPIVIDAMTNNLYRMPKSYTYSCME